MSAGIYLSSLQLELMHRLSVKASIFTAEAWALLVTLKIMGQKHSQNDHLYGLEECLGNPFHHLAWILAATYCSTPSKINST